MGVFIKKKEMPESCYECAYAIEEDGICSITEGGCEWGHSRPPHCPLEEIEIVRCGECAWYEKPYCRWHNIDNKPTDFCSYAERRTDE